MPTFTTASSYGLIKKLNRIYLYDSHAKLESGDRSDSGKSSIRTFSTLNGLRIYMGKINQLGAYYQMINLNIYVKSNNLCVQTNPKLAKSFSSMSIDDKLTNQSIFKIMI